MKMKLSSTAFPCQGPIPVDYTGDGRDLSPALSWDHAHDETQEFALICDDPDAPTSEPWVHWVVYKIPADWRQLPEGIGGDAATDSSGGILQGQNSWPSGRTTCYRGPEPPRGHGVHHYHFRLYALARPVNLPAGCTKLDLLKEIHGHVIDVAELVGTYER
ncbi:MAG: hypothetical protein JWN70_2108 [Planctomycetaceae bacterium]|nr:hypothetical protein [Planctomycetaceae bacterium]